MKQCIKGRQQNLSPQQYEQLHLVLLLMSMHFTAMDLIGMFKLLPQRHQYALTVTDMLRHTWCILLYTKEADKCMHAYFIGGLYKIFSDNGIEFKNKFFMNAAYTLGMRQVYTFPYFPWGNGCIEMCIIF